MCTTSKASSPSRNYWPEALLLCSLLALSSCSSSTEEVMVGGKPRRVKVSVSSQFEWAVQSYEAGAYEEAVSRFEKLRKDGAEVPDYDLVAYYLGMSRYRLNEFEAAKAELESFLRAQPSRQESQEARLALLLSLEKLKLWKESTALAAETDKLTLFQYNRALLKLLWARALQEQGELQGAKAVLDDSAAYLDKEGKDEGRAIPYYSNPEQDLWGRYHFTAVLLKTRSCGRLPPKETGKAKQRLYGPWLESEIDCLRAAVDTASEELFVRESSWGNETEKDLSLAIDAFASKVLGFLSGEAKQLDRHRALQKAARENFYRLLGTLDDHLKNFKNRGINTSSLETLRKQVDRLLVAISRPS
jgi:hypothetical protein